MNKIIILTTIAIAACFIACGATNTLANTIINNQSVAEFKQSLKLDNAVLIDVRTAPEYSEGHIKGAKNVDWRKRNFDSKIQQLNKSVPVVLYCRSGNRSGQASKRLLELGFTKIYNLEGGIKQWKKYGEPIVSATPNKIITNVSAFDFAKLINSNQGFTLVDVRTASEYRQGHIKGSKNIDWYNDSFENLISKLNKNEQILLYCRSGKRAGRAAKALKKLGFTNIINLSGGIRGWKNQDFPVVLD
ncbi:MAG: rhodanese-like domain-containing protein [Saprospiraceae bacterium]